MGKNRIIIVAFLACTMGVAAQNVQAQSICLDPGHGGTDGGASGCNLVESEINLGVALKLKPLLEAAGYTVYMTRTDDTTISLAGRVEYANGKGVTTFASIHTNSATATATGIETYCYTGCLSKKGNNYQQASNIQARMLEQWPLTSRGVKEAGYYVIKNTSMPATLSELGFINNCDKDAVYLGGDTHRQNAARAHCEAIVAKWGGDASKCVASSSSGGQTTEETKKGKVYAGTFAGSISDANWLGGATYAIGDQSQTSAVTKTMMKFEVPVGKYTATASKSGYVTTTRTDCAEANANAAVYCSIALAPENVSTTGIATGSVRDGVSGVNIAATVSVEGGNSVDYDGQKDWAFELNAGTYTIAATAQGYENHAVSCTVTAGNTTSCPMTLNPKKGTISGAVFDSTTSQNIPATVSLGGQIVQYSGDGVWAFTVDEGVYTLEATADHYEPSSVECRVAKGETAECNIELTPVTSRETTQMGTLRGTIADATTGELIAGDVSHGNGQVYHYSGKDKWQFFLKAGDYDVTATATGYQSKTETCTVVAAEISQCDIRLSAEDATVTGIVFDAESQERVAATVSAQDESIAYEGTGTWALQLPPGNYVFTASDGSKSGSNRCAVVAGKDNVCNIAIFDPNAPTGSLMGTVYDASNPSLKLKSQVSIDGYAPVEYDGSSTWTLENLPVRTHLVTAKADGYFENTVSCNVISSDLGIENCNIPLQMRSNDEGTTQIDAVAPTIRYESSDSCSASPVSNSSGSPTAILLTLLALLGIRRRHGGQQ